MDDRLNLTGRWEGSYSYLGGAAPDIGMLATFEEVAGLVTGASNERVDFKGLPVEARAIWRGSRDGAEVVLIKAYDGAGPFAHAVDYAGTLDEGGLRISGFWQMEGGTSGGFELTRERAAEEPEAEMVAAEEPFAALLER